MGRTLKRLAGRRVLGLGAALLLLPCFPESAAGRGEQYLEAYNVLYRLMTNRCELVGLSTADLRAKTGGDSVSQGDLSALRAKVRQLMDQHFIAPESQWQLGAQSDLEAFPLLGREFEGTAGRFLRIPAEFTTNQQAVYAEDMSDETPLLWVHFQDLHKHLLALRRTLRGGGGHSSARHVQCQWITKDEQNQRRGHSGFGMPDLGYARSLAETSFFNSSRTAYPGEAPSFYTVSTRTSNWPWDKYEALVLACYGYFQVLNLPAHPYKARFYAHTRPPPYQSYARSFICVWSNPLGIGGLQENRWVAFGNEQGGSETVLTSEQLGTTQISSISWCPDPPSPALYGKPTLETASGFMVDPTVAVLEWPELSNEPLLRPGDDDTEDDGLVDAGCECTQCEPEAKADWASFKTDVSIRFPLGLSSGRKTGGVRVKAYISERLFMGVPRQMFSLDTAAWVHTDSSGLWKMVTVKRPNGTEVVFALTGSKAGQPAEGRKGYSLTEEEGAYAVHFSGKQQVTHRYVNGQLQQVRATLQNHEITVNGTLLAWPGLTVLRSGNNTIFSVTDPLGVSFPLYTGALISDVDYKDKDCQQKHGLGLRPGSRIVVERDAQGRTNRSTRISVEGARATITTSDSSGALLRRAVREEETAAEYTQLTVRETVETAPGSALASSNATTRLFQAFPWGWELTRQEDGPEGLDAPVTAWSYNTNALDTGSYGRVQCAQHPNGTWARFEYEAQGRVAAQVTPFGNGAPEAAKEVSAVVSNWYAGDPQLAEAGCPTDVVCTYDQRPRAVLEFLQGVEVARTYSTYLADRWVRKRCSRAGARYDASDNRVTTTSAHTNGLFEGRPRWTANEAGTFAVFTYAYNDAAGQLTTTQRSGEGSPEAVTNGTETVTVTDDAGNTVSTLSRDIASGIVTAWSEYTRDSFGRVTRTVNPLDGTFTTTGYGCCGPESETDAEGITTLRAYNGLKQVESVQRLGVSERSTYDSHGNRVKVERSAGGETVAVTMTYDSAGRLIATTNEWGAVTRYAFETNAAGGERTITTQPDGGTQVEDAYRDGRPWAVTGTAVAAACFVYGAAETGPFTVEYRGADTNAPQWVKTWQNMAGQPARVTYPDGYEQRTLYDALGRATVQSDGWTTNLTAYNGQSEAYRTAIDLNGNGVIDLAGPDRVGETETGYATGAGRTVREARTWTYPEPGSAARKLVSLSRSAVDGAESWSESFGRTNHTRVTRDRATATRTETVTLPDGSRQVGIYTNGLLMSVTRFDRDGEVVSSQRRGYDAWGRLAEVRQLGASGEERVTQSAFDLAGRVTSVTVSAGGREEITRFEYDVMGRQVRTILPDGGVVLAVYDLRGNLVSQEGARTYPVGYGYDAQGRLASLATYRAGPNGAPDVTRWEYDAARGWLSTKQYADGSHLSYTSYPNGSLASRTWARGVETRYAYDAGGTLTNRWYSDGTPGVSFALDREGRAVEVRDGVDAWTNTYAADGQLEHLDQPSGHRLDYVRDSLGRVTNFSLLAPDSRLLTSVSYSYDAAGRLARVIPPGGQDTIYSYGPDGTTVTNTAQGNGLTTVRQFDGFGRMLSSRTAAGGMELGGSAYTYDAAGQRVTNTLPDGSRWAYGYDALGQLTAAKRRWADGVPMGGCQFEYAYDTLGNRTRSCLSAGRRTQWREYTANVLNQYETVTTPGQVWVTGAVATNATVSVQANEERARLANRHGEYFSAVLEVNNRDQAVAVTNTVRAVMSEVAGGVTSSLVRTETRTAFVPRTPETLQYDADGNLLRDGLWAYTWDAENRLTSVESLPAVPADRRTRLDFTYDHIGRRMEKKVFAWDTDHWSPITDHFFLYDGWNLVQEVRSQETGVGSTNSYVWGLDLSCTLQGAGGIGGLIRILPPDSGLPTPDSGPLTPVFDGHGNVTALVDNATPTNILARYEYGPFGEVLAESYNNESTRQTIGTSGFRFSTKYRDEETGLVYYGYRYYVPGMGRWLSRDPMGEAGGVGLFRFVKNNTVGSVDPVGLAVYVVSRELAIDGQREKFPDRSHVYLVFTPEDVDSKSWQTLVQRLGGQSAPIPRRSNPQMETFSFHPIEVLREQLAAAGGFSVQTGTRIGAFLTWVHARSSFIGYNDEGDVSAWGNSGVPGNTANGTSRAFRFKVETTECQQYSLYENAIASRNAINSGGIDPHIGDYAGLLNNCGSWAVKMLEQAGFMVPQGVRDLNSGLGVGGSPLLTGFVGYPTTGVAAAYTFGRSAVGASANLAEGAWNAGASVVRTVDSHAEFETVTDEEGNTYAGWAIGFGR